jgi:NAD(P)H-dependent FMN reductase
MSVLAISGSPRAASSNTALVRAVAALSTLPFRKGARAEDLAADVDLSAMLRAVVHALADAIVDGQRTGTADDQRRETREV